MPTREIIEGLEAQANAHDDEVMLLQCFRSGPGDKSMSIYRELGTRELSEDGPWQYFVRSRVATPVLPAREPLTGVGWPAVFAVNGLLVLHHPEPGSGAKDPPSSSIGIVHRAINRETGEILENGLYDRLFKGLKNDLRRQAR